MTSFQRLQRRIGGFPIEYPAGALMAVAVAFCVLAVPDWRFESAVTASGLPAILSAAQPPLGTTARLLAAFVMAALSFLAVWMILRALDAKPQASDFPAFRAADLHPDAPRRRPILAGAEFGAPVEDLPPIEDQIGGRRPLVTEPLPSFLAPQTPEREVRRPIFTTEVAAEPERVVPDTRPAPAAEARFEQEPLLKQKPVLKRETPAVRIADPSPETQSREVETNDEPASPAVLPGDHDEDEESVSELMARLESGLSKRDSRPVPGPSGSAQDELRRALGELNRVSGRG